MLLSKISHSPQTTKVKQDLTVNLHLEQKLYTFFIPVTHTASANAFDLASNFSCSLWIFEDCRCYTHNSIDCTNFKSINKD